MHIQARELEGALPQPLQIPNISVRDLLEQVGIHWSDEAVIRCIGMTQLYERGQGGLPRPLGGRDEANDSPSHRDYTSYSVSSACSRRKIS